MVRTQIQLTERQATRLKEIAANRGISVAELIRQAVDSVLESELKPNAEETRKRALAVIGKYRSGANDVSTRHDDYLSEAFGL